MKKKYLLLITFCFLNTAKADVQKFAKFQSDKRPGQVLVNMRVTINGQTDVINQKICFLSAESRDRISAGVAVATSN